MTTESTTTPQPGKDDAVGPALPSQRAVEGAPSPAVPAATPRPRRRLRWLPRYTWSGTVGALLLGYLSFTPSLLPRGWVIQGLIAGITASIGYGFGVTVAWFVRSVTGRRPSPAVRLRAWQVLAVLGPVLGLVTLRLGHRWQREIHELMGLETTAGYKYAGTVVLAVLVFALFVGIGRAVRALARFGTRLFGRILPPKLARPLAVAIAAVLVIFLVNGVLFQGLVNAANSAFSVKDDGTEEGAVRPTAP